MISPLIDSRFVFWSLLGKFETGLKHDNSARSKRFGIPADIRVSHFSIIFENLMAALESDGVQRSAKMSQVGRMAICEKHVL